MLSFSLVTWDQGMLLFIWTCSTSTLCWERTSIGIYQIGTIRNDFGQRSTPVCHLPILLCVGIKDEKGEKVRKSEDASGRQTARRS